jgi:transposase
LEVPQTELTKEEAAAMNTAIQYVGIDVHQSTLVIAVLDARGKTVMESTVATKREAIEQALRGLSGRVWVAFEEGTQAQWLYEIVSPLVERVIVCNPRETRQGENKSDSIDARGLADKLRLNALKAVFHNSAKVDTLKELVRIYESLVSDGTRSKLRLKAIFRGRAIDTPGDGVYDAKTAGELLKQLEDKGRKFRANILIEQIAKIEELRDRAYEAMVREARRHRAFKILTALPFIGPVRSAQLMAVMVTPFRFRSKRQLWKMCGLSVVFHGSADRKFVDGKLLRSKRPPMTRGLNRNHNRMLKDVFMSAAHDASCRSGPLKTFFEAMLARGFDPEMARLTLARKIAAYTLRLWKKGETFDPAKLTMSTS